MNLLINMIEDFKTRFTEKLQKAGPLEVFAGVSGSILSFRRDDYKNNEKLYSLKSVSSLLFKINKHKHFTFQKRTRTMQL